MKEIHIMTNGGKMTPNSCNDGKYYNRNHVNRAKCKPYVPCLQHLIVLS